MVLLHPEGDTTPDVRELSLEATDNQKTSRTEPVSVLEIQANIVWSISS